MLMDKTDISQIYNKSSTTNDHNITNTISAFTISDISNIDSLESEELLAGFLNGINSFGLRKRYFNNLQTKYPDVSQEAIRQICQMYEYTESRDLFTFIEFMIDYGNLNLFQKLDCGLTFISNNKINAGKCFIKIMKEYQSIEYQERPTITFYINILRYCIDPEIEMVMEQYNKDNILKSIKWLCNESKQSANFIYRTIISIQRDNDRKFIIEYLNNLYWEFFSSSIIDSLHYILAGQYLLLNGLHIVEVEAKLIQIAECSDNTIPNNIRSDAADTLIRLSSNHANRAKQIINNIGRDLTQLPTTAANKENVHMFENSINEFLLRIGSLPLAVIDDEQHGKRNITFDEVSKELDDMLIYRDVIQANKEKINSSLLRIKIDQIIYPGSQSLSTVFIKLIQLIKQHEQKELLYQRLVEELIDMADTCSSGHITRLVNVFSGIDGFSLSLSWKKQIEDNLAARLSLRINNAQDHHYRLIMKRKGYTPSIDELTIADNKFRENIMCEAINTDIEDRIHFNCFLKMVIGDIHNELYNEFVTPGHITSDVFELHFRSALSYYETAVRSD